jgi:hypothetical protein
MLCKNCGLQLPDDVNFCMNCGESQRAKDDKKDTKLFIELIYNEAGVDIYSNHKEVVNELYIISSAKIKTQYQKQLSEITSNENLCGFHYSKKFLSGFKDKSIEIIITSLKAYLIENAWECSTNTRGFDTSKYKMVFTKYNK